MLPYLTDIQHPTEQTKIMCIAHSLYKAERELEGTTHWSYIRHENPLDNLEYQATILNSIGADLRDIEGDIEDGLHGPRVVSVVCLVVLGASRNSSARLSLYI